LLITIIIASPLRFVQTTLSADARWLALHSQLSFRLNGPIETQTIVPLIWKFHALQMRQSAFGIPIDSETLLITGMASIWLAGWSLETGLADYSNVNCSSPTGNQQQQQKQKGLL